MRVHLRALGRLTRGVGGVLLLCACASGQERGLYLYHRLDATRNELGWIARLDAAAGYNFNRHLALDVGLPLYIIRPSGTAGGPALERATGFGNLHVTGRLTISTALLSYFGAVTVTAPTGEEDKGLSTGKVTWDWNNHFERSFGRITPFGAVGLANTVSDTPLFVRPFISQGRITRLEGGARCSLARRLSAGVLLYTIQPSGEQTVISRVIRGNLTRGPGLLPGRRRGRGVFEFASTTVGPPEIVRDRGGSLWVSVGPLGVLDFHAGYGRSTTYALDTVFFGVGVNVGSLIQQKWR